MELLHSAETSEETLQTLFLEYFDTTHVECIYVDLTH